MSVHAEYGRALESFLTCVQRLDSAAGNQWAAELIKARSSQNPNLSTAADLDPLREPFAHLQAHCRAVLGIDQSPPDD
jgi:hypothetical protein